MDNTVPEIRCPGHCDDCQFAIYSWVGDQKYIQCNIPIQMGPHTWLWRTSFELPEYQPPMYAPCPHATWTLWCPYANTEECEKCPVYRDREKESATYEFPRDTDMKIGGE